MYDWAIVPSPSREISGVQTMTLARSLFSYHGWMRCKISISVDAQCFESRKNEAEMCSECSMFDVPLAIESYMICDVLS